MKTLTTEQLHGIEWFLRGLAVLGIGLIVTVLVACSGPQGASTPNVLEVRGCGGLTVQWGGSVIETDSCVVKQADFECAIVKSVKLNGAPMGSGAVQVPGGDKRCGEVYGWFPAGLSVGSHAGGAGAPADKSGDDVVDGATVDLTD